jgi:hypothetical protein
MKGSAVGVGAGDHYPSRRDPVRPDQFENRRLMVAFMALLATMTVDTLGHTLNRLRLPDKMVHMLLITYRYLFVIEQEYQRLVRAMKIRNFPSRRPTCTATGPMPIWWACSLSGPRNGPGGCTAP